MGHFYDEIPDDPKLIDWIRAQKLFHVATAPLDGTGHVNLSPKGQDTFKLVSRKACWYLDLTGSGNETISHLYERGNGRMTILFQAFEGAPRLLRLYGKGKVIEYGTPEYERLLGTDDTDEEGSLGFPTPKPLPGARAIIWLDITHVGTSCGYSVPFMKFEGPRNTLNDWATKKEAFDSTPEDQKPQEDSLPPRKGLKYYWVSTNSWSIDGLPGMKGVAPLATKDIIHSTMSGAGLPTSLHASDKPGSFNVLLVWLVGLLMGMVALAAAERGVGPLLEQLNLPFARRLLEVTHHHHH